MPRLGLKNVMGRREGCQKDDPVSKGWSRSVTRLLQAQWGTGYCSDVFQMGCNQQFLLTIVAGIKKRNSVLGAGMKRM